MERDVVANAEEARRDTEQIRDLVDSYSAELTRIYALLGEIRCDIGALLGKVPT
jgi:hypothetical protein